MKSSILLPFIALFCTAIPKSHANDEMTSYAMDSYIGKYSNIEPIREIHGGTVFNVTYGNACSVELQHAFEYACKIWEENLPPCLPINIYVNVRRIGSSQGYKALSRVTTATLSEFDSFDLGMEIPYPQIKAVMMLEYQNNNTHSYLGAFNKNFSFTDYDITITYNSNMLNDFSYSIDETQTDKYDFVTVALRDIARGLGIRGNIRNNADNQLIFTTRYTNYEGFIRTALKTSDPAKAYSNATKGSLTVDLGQYYYGDVVLYAPEQWMNDVSLNTFIPTKGKKITELLTYEFGRGTMIRDISDENISDFFEYVLNWKNDKLSGGDSGNSVTTQGSTENVIPYKGTITINSPTLSNLKSSFARLTEMRKTPLARSTAKDIIEDYCLPFHPFYAPGETPFSIGSSISLLLKDGTWDVLERTGTFVHSIDFGSEKLQPNYPNEKYARTCDGYLRCRITLAVPLDGPYYRYGYICKYFALDYLPQKPQIKFSKILPQEITHPDNYQDIKIDIKNVEGADYIIVEKLELGHRVPSKFRVSDIKKGSFKTLVNESLNTKFTAIAYNKNGSTRGETIEVPAINPPSFGVTRRGNTISVEYQGKYAELYGLKEYEITSLQNSYPAISKEFLNDTTEDIDIMDMPSGAYVLTYTDKLERKHTYKFIK